VGRAPVFWFCNVILGRILVGVSGFKNGNAFVLSFEQRNHVRWAQPVQRLMLSYAPLKLKFGSSIATQT
jgi:hypothetical protein